jgi:hypothetical protein
MSAPFGKRTAPPAPAKIRPQQVRLVGHDGETAIARGMIVVDDGPLPDVIMFDGEAFVRDPASGADLRYRQAATVRAGANFEAVFS